MIMINKKSTFILNLDFKNLCRYPLFRPLPYRGFEFVVYLSMFAFDFIMNYNKESDVGYTLLMNDVDYYIYLQPIHRDSFYLKKVQLMESPN